MIWTFWPKLIDKFVEHDLDEYAQRVPCGQKDISCAPTGAITDKH